MVPLKLTSMKKIKKKLQELEAKYEKPWLDLVNEQIKMAESEAEKAAQDK